MKRCLQLVALCLVTLLGVPPAVADELCRLSQGWQQMNDGACCTSDGSSAKDFQNSALATPQAMAQSCNEGCCSVSPQSTPLPGVLEKDTIDHAPPAPCGNPVAAFVTGLAQPLDRNRGSDASPPDRQVLLQIFRI